jgi:NAD(P)H dehydrogenase (quinone)
MIVVTGASGYIGSRAISRLLDLGLAVTAMGRNAERLRQAVPPGVPTVIADYDDPLSLDRAFAQATKLLFIAGDGFAADMLRQHTNVIVAANRSAVAQVVFTSIVDVADSSPFYYAPVYRDAEQKLKASRFSSSVIRCGLYSDFITRHWLNDEQISLPLGNARIAPVARDDVAAAAVHAVLHDVEPIWALTGTESYSMAEVAAAASRVMGKTFTYRPCASEDYVKRLQAEMEQPWPVAFSSLCTSIEEGRYADTSDRFVDLMLRPPERFEDFLKRHSTSS